MRFVLGLDCGGTGTRAFVAAEGGERGAWGQAGQSNPHHADAGEVRQNVAAAIRGACDQLGLNPANCAAAFAGVAGVTDEPARAAAARLLRECGLDRARIEIDHDIRIALAGGLAGAPGIALIVGTGSSCYGRTDDGRTWQTGGWGSLIADEGSGYYLGREAIAAAVRMADGREVRSALLDAIFARLKISHVAEILGRLYQPAIPRTDVAALAPLVVSLAERNDSAARAILDRGAALVTDLVAANHRALPTAREPAVVITGGLGTAPTIYRDLIVAALRRALPAARVTDPLLPPAIGAALLALRALDRPVGPEQVDQLKRFVR